ncbi:MAG: flagellin [Rhodothermales bacterium]|nr:flagellin [Rhodothermales bacterium]MBO6780475.1 flagellin [Rhodothermales bacterium]
MGAFGDLSRINTNLQSLEALRAMQLNNSELGTRQLRLATGSKINRAEDDSAGYSIANKIGAKVRGQAQALANVGDAKSLLTIAEGSLSSVMEILMTMKEKTVQAANDTMSSTERSYIDNQLDALSAEITDILTDTKFNSASLFTSSSFSFHVEAEASDTFSVSIGTLSVAQLSVATGDINVTSAANATGLLSSIDSAITTISNKMGQIGDSQKRLTFKQEALNVAINNNEAARSRIIDADFAKEQMHIVKLQILQQTGTAAVAQANQAPQSILQLLQ